MNVRSPSRATSAATPASNGRPATGAAPGANQDEEVPWDSVPEDESHIEYRSGNEFELHPAGVYEAEFVGFKDFVDDRYQKLRLRLHFYTEVERADGEPSRLGCYTAPNLDSRAKLRSFLAALGENLDEVQAQMAAGTFRLAERVGGRVRVCVEHQARTDGQGDTAVIKSFVQLAENKPVSRRANWSRQAAS